ncbi:hypothetical protein K438DRAFT_396585 [Mycena galopus ATCC 62051]|nr:hypothetical protein K438DRAFT_396585 [Mycena galopus ATCC 62051]
MPPVIPHTPALVSSPNPLVYHLITPMPTPHSPLAPCFIGSRVREFLFEILLLGEHAGIRDTDLLVPFLVRYSSDHVRELIQYMPEFDSEVPNKTWSAAETVLLNLYGYYDAKPRVLVGDLIEFCRIHYAKSSLRSLPELQQYLLQFMSLAAPLLKQCDITISQRDFYFISGIPERMKSRLIHQVPEHQQTRSNPPPLAFSLGILRGFLDDDFLMPQLWNDPGEPLFASKKSVSPAISSYKLSSSSNSPPASRLPSFQAVPSSLPAALPAPQVHPFPEMTHIDFTPNSESDDSQKGSRIAFRIDFDPVPFTHNISSSRAQDDYLLPKLGFQESNIYYCYSEAVSDHLIERLSCEEAVSQDSGHDVLTPLEVPQPIQSSLGVPPDLLVSRDSLAHTSCAGYFLKPVACEENSNELILGVSNREELTWEHEASPCIEESDLNDIFELYSFETSMMSAFPSQSLSLPLPDHASERHFGNTENVEELMDLSFRAENPELNASELCSGVEISMLSVASSRELGFVSSDHVSEHCFKDAIDLEEFFELYSDFGHSSPDFESELDLVEFYLQNECAPSIQLSSMSSVPHFVPSFEIYQDSITEWVLNSDYTVQQNSDLSQTIPSSRETRFDAGPELSVPYPISDFESDSAFDYVTDLFIDLFMSQDTFIELDSVLPILPVPHPSDTMSSICHDDSDEDLCTILEFYSETTEPSETPEHLSLTEPIIRAEPQPFFLHKSYSNHFVSELLIKSHVDVEPRDEPPSYQDSILTSEPSFAFSRPKIKAESPSMSPSLRIHIPILFFIALLLAFGLYSAISVFPSAIRADHNFETIVIRNSTPSTELTQVSPTVQNSLSFSLSSPNSIVAEHHGPDKHIHLSFPCAIPFAFLNTLFQRNSEGEIQSIPLCGRVARLPRRLSPSHGLRSSSSYPQLITNYFISLLPRIFSTVYSRTHYFPPFMLPDLFCSCVIASELIPLPSRYLSDFKINYSTMQEISVIELSDFSPYHLLISHLHHRHFFILTTYRQCNVPDPSCQPSRTTPGIELTVAWAPTRQCCGGSMLSLFRLCVAPGWLD